MNSINIEKVTVPSEDAYEALKRLVPLLGAHKVMPTWDEFCALVNSEASLLVAARDTDAKNQIVGILSLSIYRVPTGIRSIIEDVVVDEQMRGRGIGKALVGYAIELARQAGANGISLTSNPQREAANRLYQSMGFELRRTNPYFYKL